MDRYLLSYGFIAILLCACHDLSPDALEGNWKATTVVEEGDTLDLDLKNVTLGFSGNNFKYQHTQRDSLEGTFAISKGLINLYVQNPGMDTIVLQINDLESSSLILRMNHEGKERLVSMTK